MKKETQQATGEPMSKRLSRHQKKRNIIQAKRKAIFSFGSEDSDKIHDRANNIAMPKMFDVVDKFAELNKPSQMSEEYSGAAHESGCALREEASVRQFGKRQEHQWDYVVDEYTTPQSKLTHKPITNNVRQNRRGLVAYTHVYTPDEIAAING
jgi:hypothetical protein